MNQLYIMRESAVHPNHPIPTMMAGIIKRNNTWVAIIKLSGGNEVCFSTNVPILPRTLKPGATAKSV